MCKASRLFGVLVIVLAVVGFGFLGCASRIIGGREGDYQYSFVKTGKKTTVRIDIYLGKNTDIVIPERVGGKIVTAIGKGSYGGKGITSVVIPKTVIEIHGQAFINNNISRLIIPEGVQKIGSLAFQNNKITELSLPSTLVTIEDGAFENNQLTAVELPNGLKELSGFNMNKLTALSIPESVTSIGYMAFTSNKLTTISIPLSVTAIGDRAFDLNNLSSVSFPVDIENIHRLNIGNDVFGKNKATTVRLLDDVTVDVVALTTTINDARFRDRFGSLGIQFMEGNYASIIDTVNRLRGSYDERLLLARAYYETGNYSESKGIFDAMLNEILRQSKIDAKKKDEIALYLDPVLKKLEMKSAKEYIAAKEQDIKFQRDAENLAAMRKAQEDVAKYRGSFR